jgi:integrase
MNNLDDFKNHLIALGYQSSTIEKYLSYILKLRELSQEGVDRLISQYNHRVCRSALKKYVIDYHKLHDIEIKFKRDFRQGKLKPKGLNQEELNLFINALKPRDKLISALMVETGFRVSEILKLTPSNFIDLNVKVNVKGGREETAIISNELKGVVDGYISTQNIGYNEPLFSISRHGVWFNFKMASEQAGIRHVYPHLLKHTTSRRCDEKGLTLDEKYIILHHTTPATTIQHYHNPKREDIWKKYRK